MTKFKLFATFLVLLFIGLFSFLFINHQSAVSALGDTIVYEYTYIAPQPAEGAAPVEGAPEPGTTQKGKAPQKVIIGQDVATKQALYDQLTGLKVGDEVQLTFPAGTEPVPGVSQVSAKVISVRKCNATDIKLCTLEAPATPAPAQ